jgi:CheY-like chemotaxis protein
MVYGIVKQHDGYITCHSRPGAGTTFQIYLPAIEAEEDEKELPHHAIAGGRSETILLADDEEFVRTLGARMLTRAGYTVLTASNKVEALELYKEQRDKISLIILDLVMPEMGGKQCLDELLKIDPRVKVLIASGLATDSGVHATLESGARGFVGKPFKMMEMLKEVWEVLNAD